MVQAVDSSNVTSADLKKQIMEQTQALADAATSPTAIAGDVVIEEEETPTEETETTEQTEEQEAEETKVEEEETTEEVETPPKKETLHKLKVEGKEEELPYEKIIAYAQQGRFLEKEKHRLNEEKQRLAEERAQLRPAPEPSFDQEKAKEAFWNQAAANPFDTFGMLVNTVLQTRENQQTEERKADKAFERSRAETDPDTWKIAKPLYDQYREDGMNRDQAYLMAENDLLRQALTTAKTKGIKEGADKIKARQRAEIPTGAGKVKSKAKPPSPEELKKLPAKEMRKHLPRAEAPPDW